MSSFPAAEKVRVSMRGASRQEISRDDLLEKVAQEREIRSHARRAAAAALFIQRVWRRYYVIKKVAEQLQCEWDNIAAQQIICKTRGWISSNLIRSFIFFSTQSSTLPQKLKSTNLMRMSTCFQILLKSMSSAEPDKNYCFLALGSSEEKSTWLYQAQKLVSICSWILAECHFSSSNANDIVPVTVLAMRLVVSLTDPKVWKGINDGNFKYADISVNKLIGFISSRRSAIYSSVRRYIMNFCASFASQKKSAIVGDHFLITASAITFILLPFHAKILGCNNTCDLFDVKDACEQLFIFIMTIPHLTECLPPLLLPALRHSSVLWPCLNHLLICKDKIFNEILKLDQSEMQNYFSCDVSPSGWALANVINLAAAKNDSFEPLCFVQDLDCRLYVHAVNCISENFLVSAENDGQQKNQDQHAMSMSSSQACNSNTDDIVKIVYTDLLKPVHQQWHLRWLLSLVKDNSKFEDLDVFTTTGKLGCYMNFSIQTIVLFYYHMLRIFDLMNPYRGSWPVLCVLSFMPGFLVDLWKVVEDCIFNGLNYTTDESQCIDEIKVENCNEAAEHRKIKQMPKDPGSRLVNVLQKITGKSPDISYADPTENFSSNSGAKEIVDNLWDVESLRRGSLVISKDLLYKLHLFCAAYAHLLLVLDDVEFYEKQVPFMLQQQRKIAAALNTYVYNSVAYACGQNHRPIVDAAIRCLHLLYERNCRRKFCPISLWLGPARKGRAPLIAAARAHEAAFTNLKFRDASSILCKSSVLTTVPHVYAFEERVQMFREFIKLDKISRIAAGDVSVPGPGSIDIVVHRNQIVDDGFKQLNGLGSKLKSWINVSFVNDCGLPEVGLDFGGLSKEFLTDLARTAFNPQFGLFSQTSTSDRCLIPNISARLLNNGMEMIEFLGRVVGKALYEGILLDYSFSLVFVQKLLGRYSFLDELAALDPELHKNLIYVKHYDGDVAELCLDFTVTEELCGKLVVTELKPGGKNISVTNENKLHYVHAIADYKLNRQILPFANSFYRGLIDLISPAWLILFDANEFNQLLSGGEHDFNVVDLRTNTRYTGGFSEGSRTIKIFWEVLKGFKPIERCLLLKFVTSCSRAPLLGFKHLQPPFTIHKVPCDMPLWATIGGQDVDRLPSASTCYNTLKLPTYKRLSTLRTKLLYAINSNAGFELS